MQNIQLRHMIYAFMTLLALSATILSIRKARILYKQEANQQRFFFKCFIASLTCYFLGGFWGGIYIFHHDPLTSFCRVIAFTEIPTYSLCFLLMSFLYLITILVNAILKIRQGDEVKDSMPEVKGWTKAKLLCKRFANRHPDLTYILVYTACFLVILSCVFAVNFSAGKGFIWRIDGKSQYLPYMEYTADYLRDMMKRFSQGNFTIKMYDFSIGMGEDVRAVVRIHPTEFLAAFFKTSQLEKLYNYLMIFRFWLAGLSFFAYCRYRGISRRNTLVASFTYIFSGYGINLATRHPIFHSPVIFFPLLLIAMDRLIEKKGSLFFTFMVALSLSTNYYFLYMTTIALGFYALVRFASIYKENKLKEFAIMMGKIIAFYLIGVGIGAVFFLPTVIRALGSERVGSVKTMLRSLYSYSNDQYYKLFASTITGHFALYDIYLAFASIFIPAVIILFLRRFKEHLGLKILILIETVALLLPAAGLAMSAFSTVTNRWIYVVAMTAAYTIAVTLDDFLRIRFLQMLAILGTVVLYAFTCLFLTKKTEHILDLKLSFLILVITVFLLLFIKATHYVTKNQLVMAMLLLTTISLTAHGVYLYGNPIDPFSEEFLETGKEAREFFEKDEFKKFEEKGESSNNDFYRIDLATQRDYYENMGVLFDYNGTAIYNSVINANLVNSMVDLDSIGISAVHRIYNLDGRTALEALGCVKYYQVAAGNNLGVPYGFVRNEAMSNDDFWVYENKHLLNIGYAYKNIMDISDYEDLSPLEKQQAMLKTAVIDTKDAKVKPNTHEVDTGEILVRKAKISKVDESLKSGDNYIEFINTEGNHGLIMSYTQKDEEKVPGFSITFHRKKGYEIYLKLEDFDTNIQRAKFFVSNNRFNKLLIVRNTTDNYSLGRNDYYVNLGYSQGYGDETVRLQFYDRADYTIKDIKLYYVPMASYKEDLKTMSQGDLENVALSDNTIRGTVQTDQDEVLVLSVPYAKGWTAKLDGKVTAIFKANGALSAIKIPAGSHKLIMTYETPGLKLGALISLFSLVLSLLIAISGGLLWISKRSQEAY